MMDTESRTGLLVEQQLARGYSSTEEEEGEVKMTQKRNSDEEYFNNKKRRKQLKPNKISSIDETIEMVKVPTTLSELSKSSVPPRNVEKSPNRNRSPLKDVHIQNESEFEATLPVTPVTISPPINVPKLPLGPILSTNLMFPFSSPELLASSNYWQDRVRIFNQEAYCELCKKEFCNKYFLKTHKANKHGILTDGRKDGEEISSFLSEDFRDDKMKAFCDVCNRRFCNKYFVRRHKSKSHGVIDMDEPSSCEATSDQDDVKSTTNGVMKVDNHSQEPDELEQKSPLNLIVSDSNNSNEEIELNSKPDECSTENLEKLQTMLLRLTPSQLPDCKDSIDNEEDDSADDQRQEATEFYFSKLEDLKQQNKSQPTSSYCEICNKELCNKYFMRTHMQRMHGIEIEQGTQLGGVVCNICNKELCSKYFLRVHKQNTHGIGSPGGPIPSTSNSSQSPPKELSSNDKFFSNVTQVCFLCNRRFRSPKWLQAHLLSDHREEMLKSEEQRDETIKIPRQEKIAANAHMASKLFWENSTSPATYSCSQCPFSTPVLAFLFVHERSHFVFNLTGAEEREKNGNFWQEKISEDSDCLDLSMKNVSTERKGS